MIACRRLARLDLRPVAQVFVEERARSKDGFVDA